MVAAVGPGPPHRRRHARVRDHPQRGRVRSRARRPHQPRRPHPGDQPGAARRAAAARSGAASCNQHRCRSATYGARGLQLCSQAPSRPEWLRGRATRRSRPPAGNITLVAQQSTAEVNRTVDSVTNVLLVVVPAMILARRARGVVLHRSCAAAGRSDPASRPSRSPAPPCTGACPSPTPTTRSVASPAR